MSPCSCLLLTCLPCFHKVDISRYRPQEPLLIIILCVINWFIIFRSLRKGNLARCLYISYLWTSDLISVSALKMKPNNSNGCYTKFSISALWTLTISFFWIISEVFFSWSYHDVPHYSSRLKLNVKFLTEIWKQARFTKSMNTSSMSTSTDNILASTNLSSFTFLVNCSHYTRLAVPPMLLLHYLQLHYFRLFSRLIRKNIFMRHMLSSFIINLMRDFVTRLISLLKKHFFIGLLLI